ncbi:MAG: PH domain-containing protein [Myxococcaceae bacterium]|nr:PH domain-containing protein [Myxococcaceae bacterium]
MSGHHDFEAQPGLPEALPEGERLLWQGRPSWRLLARHQLKARWLAVYFAVFAAAKLMAGSTSGDEVASLPAALGLVAFCLGLLCTYAFFSARATLYSITTHRIVLRIGVALPLTVNLPFKRLASADAAVRSEADGDIVLSLAEHRGLKWLYLWPHVALAPLRRPRAMLVGLTEPVRVAGLLGEAVREWAARTQAPLERRVAPHVEAEPLHAPASLATGS